MTEPEMAGRLAATEAVDLPMSRQDIADLSRTHHRDRVPHAYAARDQGRDRFAEVAANRVALMATATGAISRMKLKLRPH
jgi:hypothetical protein